MLLKKLSITNPPELVYELGGQVLNSLLGRTVALEFTGKIFCISCGSSTRSSFNQGHCYNCFVKLASCDLCQVKPELCHHDKNTCRQPEWGVANCMIRHVVYLAATSKLKIGIAREHQKFTRFADQGARQVIELFYVGQRLHSGLAEIELAKIEADRTDWRKLVTGQDADFDLLAEKKRILEALEVRFDFDSVPADDTVHQLKYPVLSYPLKAKTWVAEKEPRVEGIFTGCRGQYLFIGDKAINIRKYQGYEADFRVTA